MTTVDTTKLKVDDIRKILVGDYQYDRERLDEIKGKAKLVELLQNELASDEFSSVFDEASVVDTDLGGLSHDVSLNGEPIKKEVKSSESNINDPGWTDYVLSQLTEKEVQNGRPTVHGLRRITEISYGEVIESLSDIEQLPDTNNGNRATVKASLTVERYDGKMVKFQGVCDVNHSNTEAAYAKHAVATAESRAEARAYKKMLRLNILTAEETVDPTQIDDPGDKIRPQQEKMINVLSERLSVNLDKLLEKWDLTPDTLGLTNHSTAKDICGTINSFQTTGVPEQYRLENSNES
tara:strand:+ start:16538 stop:17419 length:882 start_codon:yes stop_codon:yes gene_type:complete